MSQDNPADVSVPDVPLKAAPDTVALRAQPRSVTRLNRRMLAALCGGLSVAVLGALMWSLQPQRRGANESTELYNVDRVSRSEGLDQLPSDYSKLPPTLPSSVPELGPPLPGDLGPAIVNSQQPAMAGYAPPGHDSAEAQRLARLKEAEEAAASSVFFRTGTQTAAPVAQSQVEAASGFAANAAFDPLAAGPTSTAAQPVDPTAVQNRQNQKEAFLAGGTTQTRNSGNLQMPASPYQVMAGTVIAGALVTGIKSDLPGDVIATVTEPVYDTATGKFLLIPQGSRILGKYNSQVSYGQSRVQVQNAPPFSIHLMVLATAPVTALLPAVPPFVPGCWLLVPTVGSDFLGVLPVGYGALPSWILPLPEFLDSGTLYFQDFHTDTSGSFQLVSTQRLAVPILK